jgi:ABC-type antimicrobial peptide transport system permease subunit
LGAERREIFALALPRSLLQLLPGLGLGSALAFALGKPLASELIGVAAVDLQISLLVAACVSAVSLVAIILPAWRAMNVDPLAALRAEG